MLGTLRRTSRHFQIVELEFYIGIRFLPDNNRSSARTLLSAERCECNALIAIQGSFSKPRVHPKLFRDASFSVIADGLRGLKKDYVRAGFSVISRSPPLLMYPVSVVELEMSENLRVIGFARSSTGTADEIPQNLSFQTWKALSRPYMTINLSRNSMPSEQSQRIAHNPTIPYRFSSMYHPSPVPSINS